MNSLTTRTEAPRLEFDGSTIPEIALPYTFGQPVERNVFMSCLIGSFAISRGVASGQIYYLRYLSHNNLLDRVVFGLSYTLPQSKIPQVFSSAELLGFYNAYSRITDETKHVQYERHPNELPEFFATEILASLLSDGFDQIYTGSASMSNMNFINSEIYDDNPAIFLRNLNEFVTTEKKARYSKD
jgi:hypothetical protein